MSEEKQAYTGIFKSTFLFGFVQVFNILVKMIANKAVALLLGANGMGIVGLFNSSIGMIQIGAGLGLSQSAVRDISEANASEDTNRFSRIISLTNRVLLFTAFLGVIVTISLSPWLSEWSFGNKNYTFAYIWLSIVVGLNILTEGQLAILKGMRRLRALAKASRDVQIAFANELLLICDEADFPIETQIISKVREINNYKSFWCIEKIKNVKLEFELKNGRKPKVALMRFHFKLTNYKEAIEKATIFAFLVAHKEFNSIEIGVDKVVLDFCETKKFNVFYNNFILCKKSP